MAKKKKVKRVKNATFRLKSLSSNENKNELEYIIRIKHEVMLFTLETQSSKKLSLIGVLLSIE